ncbi:MAG: hypothetical protein PHQ80_02695 [Candidatus ainarchaeum sp.]|nr:hypothetical protein [Candidatus ainarchaeum sp.]MDD5096243.1 hypothetical protein [Candidatus ainarchaeum sp.]
MGDVMGAVRAVLALALGLAVGYFWKMTRPADDLLTVAGVTIVSILILFFLLKAIGKGS